MSTQLLSFESNEILVEALADRIAELLAAAIEEKGSASIAVSGGNTPKTLFQRLANISLPWHKVVVTLVDERWVDDSHQDSNAKLVKENLLIEKAAAAQFVPLKTEEKSAVDAVQSVSKNLQALPRPLDVVILGMGDDGHTASFFPGAETVSAAIDRETQAVVCAVTPLTAPHERMTLTLPVIESARHAFLHIVGEKKFSVLESAEEVGPVEELPIRTILFSEKLHTDIYYAPQ